MLRCLKLLLFIVSISVICFAQDRGTITGTVTDSSAASVGGASVSAKNIATGLEQTTVSESTAITP